MGTAKGNKFEEPPEWEWCLIASWMLMGIHACMLSHRVVLEKLLRLLHWDICELRELGTWNSKLKGNFLRSKLHFGIHSSRDLMLSLWWGKGVFRCSSSCWIDWEWFLMQYMHMEMSKCSFIMKFPQISSSTGKFPKYGHFLYFWLDAVPWAEHDLSSACAHLIAPVA